MRINLEEAIEILEEHLVSTRGVYKLGLQHAIWILEEKLDEEERKRLIEEEFRFNQRNG